MTDAPPTTTCFHALGVGPGDPELLTLKALAILQQAEVIYHAGPAVDQGRALDIVRRWLKPEQRLVAIRGEAMASTPGYREAAERIAADCRAGRRVVFITEGDPTLYSTASYLWQELAQAAPDVPIEVVPGVSSITAAAARVRWPLGQKGDTIAIVPVHYQGGHLGEWVGRASTCVFLKPAERLAELAAAGAGHDAVYLENVAAAGERIEHDLTAIGERREYFALVLVKRRAGAETLRIADCGLRIEKPGSDDLQPAICNPQCSVSVVGIGPGAIDLLTPRARNALQDADVIVGYDPYLRHLAALNLNAKLVRSPIGEEAKRARQVLELAAAGKRVALVSSGDAGVYGMASLLLEMAPEGLAVEVIPGVTAATAAAALLGAPLGHDFACISLSDLLTPWEVIERRLEAAAQCDFVIAIYNPTSQKRTWQLGRARDIFLKHRPADTVVGVVDRAFREGQSVRTITLGDLSADGIGMETILIVGGSQTRIIQRRMVTPRGYLASRGREPSEEAPVADTCSGGLRPRLAGAGARIMSESFAIIDRELGPVDLSAWLHAVVRRMVHASADFDYVQSIRHSPGFEAAFREAWQKRSPIVTDVEMVRLGIASTWQGLTVHCHLNDPQAAELAEASGLTRTAAGIRLAARRHPGAILVIGNAPTAIDETLRLVEAGEWKPSGILGLPVGFVGVTEAKARLQAQTRVPYLTNAGRKGGSAVAAAACNALIEWLLYE